AGFSFSLISPSHAGCTQSPVPTTVMPLRAAHHARCSRSRSRLVAREYLECTCRSAWNAMAPLCLVHESCRGRRTDTFDRFSMTKHRLAQENVRLSTKPRVRKDFLLIFLGPGTSSRFERVISGVGLGRRRDAIFKVLLMLRPKDPTVLRGRLPPCS